MSELQKRCWGGEDDKECKDGEGEVCLRGTQIESQNENRCYSDAWLSVVACVY